MERQHSGPIDRLVGQAAATTDPLRQPAIGTLLLVANGAIALSLHRAERPAAHILFCTALAGQRVIGSGAWILLSKDAGKQPCLSALRWRKLTNGRMVARTL